MAERIGGSHSIHFPPSGTKSVTRSNKPDHASDEIDRPPANAPEPQPVNVLGCFSTALQQAELIREQLRSLVISENRHGDLMVARTAARRLESALSILIEAEENS